MGNSAHKDASAASRVHRVEDEVLRIAYSEHASTAVTGGSRPHVTITKHVTDFDDTYFRSLLSGIEFATHGHFDHGRDAGGYTEWILKSRFIDVTVRATKGLG
jgi:hypothetical protein